MEFDILVKVLRVELLNSKQFFASMRLSADFDSNYSGMHDEGIERMHVVCTRTNPRVGSDLVSDVISKRVCDKSLTRPTDVVYDLKKDYGLEISYQIAWLGIGKARGEMFGAHSILFDQLRWYNTTVMENNPGEIQGKLTSRNRKGWQPRSIPFSHSNRRFRKHNELVLVFGTPYKRGDGAENTYVSHGPTCRTIRINTHQFLTSHHAFYSQHLQRNLQDKLHYVNSSYQVGMLSKFCACAYAPTVATFNRSLEEFMKCGRKVVPTFLKYLLPEHWVNVYFR
ncbi:hypothetical protein ACSBR2_033575 [Camellia fascicularis]